MPGKIVDIISPKSYLIQVKDVMWKRHTDQLKHRFIPLEQCTGELGDKYTSYGTINTPRTTDEHTVIRKPSK